MKKWSLLTVVALLTMSCSAQWGKRIKGNGNNVTIERNTREYDAVAVSGWFDVELVEGREGELTLSGESNLLEYIKTEVKNGKLVIKSENGVNLKPTNWKNGILITVPVTEISELSLSGSGDIRGKTSLAARKISTTMSGSGDISLDVEADEVVATMSGSGDIHLSGSCTDFDATISGSGDIKAFDLESDNVSAVVSGSADIKVTANKTLKARVSGSGDITYRGNPDKVDTKSSGSGDITRY